MSEHTAMQEDIRELRAQRDQAWVDLAALRTRAEKAETELATLKANVRGVIGTASAEASLITDVMESAGTWLSVVRVYAEALETIGGLVDAERAVES
jgi:chromosome segregation ATPase